jgi:predicted DNA-binding helix-hairpin-helix protein
VPGIGPKTAEVILRERRRGKLRDLVDLRRLGGLPSRAAGFVLLDGKRPPYQLSLWPDESRGGGGDLGDS